MTDENRTQIEELLTAIVDDQATERQHVEFKRLVQHDPAIADELKALQRQKQLLAALPVETAPASLAQDISAVLQRKLILGDTPTQQYSAEDTGHLMMRRLLTTAAMLLLPLGMLLIVIFQIIKPASIGPGTYIPTDQMLVQSPPSPAESGTNTDLANLPFEGILTFKTDRQMTVSNYIEKMIFDQGLMNFTLPNRTVDVTTYQITASPTQIGTLLDSLKGPWYQSNEVMLTVVDGSENNTIQIPNVLPEQVKVLTGEDNPDMLTYLASQYAKANEEPNTSFARSGSEGTMDLSSEDLPPLTVPIPTGRYSLNDVPTEPAGPTIRLRIHVKRAVE